VPTSRWRGSWGCRLVAAAALAVACGGEVRWDDERRPSAASAERGRTLIHAYGGGACHFVPGVPGAHGRVGPNLTGFGRQRYLAGGLIRNTPEQVSAFIDDPAALRPGSTMPAVGVSPADAADMAAYLHTLE
jgi:cytochrome c